MPGTSHVAQRDLERTVQESLSRLLQDQSHLARAVLAERLSAVAHHVAKAEVTAAREGEGAGWDEVGRAFGMSADDAHEWFRTTPMGLPQ